MTEQEEYLLKHKAYNWKWPGDGADLPRNCWPGPKASRQGAPGCTKFTSLGPSKRTLSRRKARKPGRAQTAVL